MTNGAANLNLKKLLYKNIFLSSQIEDQTIQPEKSQSPKAKNKLLKIFPSQVEDQSIQPEKSQSPKAKNKLLKIFPSQVEDQSIQPGKNSKSKS